MGFYYGFVKKQYRYTDNNYKERANFAENHIRNETDFMKVIFSDEKRFTLNSPDNLGTYFYQDSVNINKQSRTKTFNGGGGVMILGAISSNGNLKVKIIHGKYTAKNYKEDLENEFIPWSKAEFPNETVIWQQDNASIHTSVSGTDLFSRNNITLLD